MLNVDTCTTMKSFVFVHLQGDGGVSAGVRRNTNTLKKDEIKDTEEYEIPVHSVHVSIYVCGQVRECEQSSP